MKTASKLKKRAVTAAPARLARRFSGTKTEVLLAGRLMASADDRATLVSLTGALPEAGTAARLWRPFEDSLADCRCLHLLGTAAEFLPVAEAARRIGVKVVLSPQTWQNDIDPGPRCRSWVKRSAAWIAKGARAVFSRPPVWQRELYAAADLLLPNSNVEAYRIARRFKLPLDRFRVVPHGVDPKAAVADPEIFCRHAKVRDFVLYVGAIEPNNQQVGFLWATKDLNVPVVFLGDVAPQCDWYLEECRRVAGLRAQFLPRLPADHPRLAGAYAACACLVVGSGVPAPERVALAAGASGAPLVLYEGGCGSEYFGQQAVYIRPDNTASMRRGVEEALNRKRSKNLADYVRTYFSWHAVARTLRDAYEDAGRAQGRLRMKAEG